MVTPTECGRVLLQLFQGVLELFVASSQNCPLNRSAFRKKSCITSTINDHPFAMLNADDAHHGRSSRVSSFSSSCRARLQAAFPVCQFSIVKFSAICGSVAGFQTRVSMPLRTPNRTSLLSLKALSRTATLVGRLNFFGISRADRADRVSKYDPGLQ